MNEHLMRGLLLGALVREARASIALDNDPRAQTISFGEPQHRFSRGDIRKRWKPKTDSWTFIRVYDWDEGHNAYYVQDCDGAGFTFGTGRYLQEQTLISRWRTHRNWGPDDNG